jgi:hypothetical protein
MKSLFLSLLMLISTVAFADSVDVKTFNYDGVDNSTSLTLNTEKTRTEWRQERFPDTCYRVTYRRQCHVQNRTCRTRCDRNGNNCRRICTGGQRVCRDVAVRTPYTCWRYRDVAYQVHDYDVITNAILNFNSSDVDGGANENFKVRVQGERDGITVKGSGNYAVVLEAKDSSETSRTGLKEITTNYDIKFIKAKRITETLGAGIQEVKYRNGTLNFAVGKGFNTQEFVQNLKIYRHKRIGKDVLLLDKDLSDNEMEISVENNRSKVSINLRNLGITLPKKMRVIMNTSYKLGSGVLLNDNVKTEASANWLFR